MFELGSVEAYAGTMRRPETGVLAKLADIKFSMDRVEIMKGWADQTLADPRASSRAAFGYIDFDLCEPIRDTFPYVDAHLDRGARVVVNDYGFFSEGAQLATDDFIASASGRWTLRKPFALAGYFAAFEKVSGKK